LDPNSYNRVDAMKQLTDTERITLLNDPSAAVSMEWLELFGRVLSDCSLSTALKAYFLRIDEQPLDRDYITWYPELVDARAKLMLAVNRCYRSKLLDLFERLDTYSVSNRSSPKDGIEDRMLKAVLLDLIIADDSSESHELVIRHFRSATTANDRVTALAALNRSSSPSRHEVLEKVYHMWKGHLSGYANYLRVVAAGTRPDVFDMIETEKKRPSFDITQPTWCRALFLPMAANNKMIWTDRGINWMSDTVIALSQVNITTTGRLLNTFQHVARLKPVLKEKVNEALARIVANVSKSEAPAIYGQAKAYLGSGESGQ
ncbi:MAG: aminopeptidase N C-terminal domain-containing protein, partial [Syntrophales bacterium LBB04]|nr:aminopeptidase N C-terminal domain-containing protein [Syntrophales bacterium LBB04]